jgi:hypothetical protein
MDSTSVPLVTLKALAIPTAPAIVATVEQQVSMLNKMLKSSRDSCLFDTDRP